MCLPGTWEVADFERGRGTEGGFVVDRRAAKNRQSAGPNGIKI